MLALARRTGSSVRLSLLSRPPSAARTARAFQAARVLAGPVQSAVRTLSDAAAFGQWNNLRANIWYGTVFICSSLIPHTNISSASQPALLHRRPHAKGMQSSEGAKSLRGLWYRRPPAQEMPQPRPRAARGAQVFPLRRDGPYEPGLHATAEVFWLRTGGAYPPGLHDQPTSAQVLWLWKGGSSPPRLRHQSSKKSAARGGLDPILTTNL
ncbi:hypothetical protein C8R47DRAFT_1079542 [Mycena vitilis]|nr:hypothetical protein C8R47DRAFT_1079542 [Mycena vitilis]